MPEAGGQPIGSTWARKYPERYREYGVGSPPACPVCGHPIGACKGGHVTEPATEQFEISPGVNANRVARSTRGEVAADFVVVPTEVLEDFEISKGVTASRVKYRAGQRVPRGEYEAAMRPTSNQRGEQEKHTTPAEEAKAPERKQARRPSTNKTAKAGRGRSTK